MLNVQIFWDVVNLYIYIYMCVCVCVCVCLHFFSRKIYIVSRIVLIEIFFLGTLLNQISKPSQVSSILIEYAIHTALCHIWSMHEVNY